MIKVDKSSEADAKAALLKLKQKKQVGVVFCNFMLCIIRTFYLFFPLSPFGEQEIERKVRKQFKGLFDKKPGEISDAGTEEEGDHTLAKEGNEGDSEGNNSEESHEAAEDAHQARWFSFWPTGRRLFSALGLQRCTIL